MRNESPQYHQMAGIPKEVEKVRVGLGKSLARKEYNQTRLTPLLSGAGRWPWGRGGVFNLRKKKGTSTRGVLSISTPHSQGGSFPPSLSTLLSLTWDPGASGSLAHKGGQPFLC